MTQTIPILSNEKKIATVIEIRLRESEVKLKDICQNSIVESNGWRRTKEESQKTIVHILLEHQC